MGTDACFAPVLSMEEAIKHPHNVFRKTFVEIDGIPQPAPAPRFSRTKPQIGIPAPSSEEHNALALLGWGFPAEYINEMKKKRVILE